MRRRRWRSRARSWIGRGWRVGRRRCRGRVGRVLRGPLFLIEVGEAVGGLCGGQRCRGTGDWGFRFAGQEGRRTSSRGATRE